MKRAALVARILLGLVFAVFGLNHFFAFLPTPPLEGAAGEFAGALVASGYFFTFLKVTESVCGLLLLAGFYVPLALTILAPIVLNIVLFHLFLAPEGLIVAVVILALEVFLAYSYKNNFKSVLVRNARLG